MPYDIKDGAARKQKLMESYLDEALELKGASRRVIEEAEFVHTEEVVLEESILKQ